MDNYEKEALKADLAEIKKHLDSECGPLWEQTVEEHDTFKRRIQTLEAAIRGALDDFNNYRWDEGKGKLMKALGGENVGA